MKISRTSRGNAVVLKLEGSFLSEEHQQNFRKAIYAIVQEGCKHVVVDLEHVEHISSLGLGGLIAGMTSLRREGGDLRLCAPPQNIGRILGVTRLDHVFDISRNLDEATSAGLNL